MGYAKRIKGVLTIFIFLLIAIAISTLTFPKEIYSENINPKNTIVPTHFTTTNKTSKIDTSTINKGYVSFQTELNDCIAHIVHENEDYNYILQPNQLEQYQLTLGNGDYEIGIYQKIKPNSTQYKKIISENINLNINSVIQGLYPNTYTNPDNNPQTLALSEKLKSPDNIINWVGKNINYDFNKAEKLSGKSGYTFTNPDVTLQSELGICIDKSTLAATMLKHQNIPTYIICGNIKGIEAKHAWIKSYINGVWKNIDVTPTNPYTINEQDIENIDKII